MTQDFPHQKRPCAECPWRTDVEPGKFPPERFEALAHTAYDMSMRVFACHMSPEGGEVACAGFLLQQGLHNLAVRFACRSGFDLDTIKSNVKLYNTYIEMAVANGLDEDDPVLDGVRIDGQLRRD